MALATSLPQLSLRDDYRGGVGVSLVQILQIIKQGLVCQVGSLGKG